MGGKSRKTNKISKKLIDNLQALRDAKMGKKVSKQCGTRKDKTDGIPFDV